MDNLANNNGGPGILNVSTISMEFATHHTKGSGQYENKHAVNGQVIGGGVTITSMEDQLLEDEYQNEQLRQMGFFAENNTQSANAYGAHEAPVMIEGANMPQR